MNWKGKQLPVRVTQPGAADPRREIPARNRSTVSNELHDRVRVSEPVEHGDGELVCVRERDALAGRAPQGEEPRSCRDNLFPEWGGTLCERNTRVSSPERTREGLSGPATSAQQRRPPRHVPGEGLSPS